MAFYTLGTEHWYAVALNARAMEHKQGTPFGMTSLFDGPFLLLSGRLNGQHNNTPRKDSHADPWDSFQTTWHAARTDHTDTHFRADDICNLPCSGGVVLHILYTPPYDA